MTDQQPDDEKARRREHRKKKARERMAKHGRDLGKVYRDAVLKRTPRKAPEPTLEDAP